MPKRPLKILHFNLFNNKLLEIKTNLDNEEIWDIKIRTYIIYKPLHISLISLIILFSHIITYLIPKINQKFMHKKI